MAEQFWQQTRHGGFRRTRVAQKSGTSEETSPNAERVANLGAGSANGDAGE